ncbi:MAG: T9SS type A sorting domain-containing protein [Flavobacteriales bacterium]|nr:T9SS type A sorting domain-containing protein [Flavobacteriales bacterium]
MAQKDSHPCKTTEVLEKFKKSNPAAYKTMMAERAASKTEARNRASGIRMQKAATTYVMPIVFHIIHNNGAGNIPESDVFETVAMLNEDFSGNSPYINLIDPDFAADYGDIGFEFRLAQIDPDGGATNGIHYYQSAVYFDGDKEDPVEWIQDQWTNPWAYNEYVNIFVVTSPGGAYAWSGKNNDATGVVIHYGYIGESGSTPNTDERSWLTHELAHTFNIDHTWGNGQDAGQNGNCGGDDGMDDTPDTEGTYGCDLNQVTCGSKDMVQNVMDYSSCGFFLTNDQAAAMVAHVTSNGHNNIYTQANLIKAGVDNSEASCSITVLCNDAVNGSATVEVSGADAPFSIDWSNGSSASGLASGDTDTDSSLPSGNVTVTVTDNSAATATCTATCTATISTTSDINISSAITDASECGAGCDGAVDLTASGDGIGSAVVSINTSASGYWGYTDIVDGDCATDAYYIDFTPNSLSYATVDETSISSICVSFTHPSPADLKFTVVTADAGGNYYYLDLVEVGDIPNGADIDYACFTRDATASISTGTAPFTGEWKPTEDFTTPGFDLDGTVTTNYWYLSVYDCVANGQTGTIDYFEVNFFDGVDNTTYSWSNNDNTVDVADLCIGTYTVTVTDNNGCSATHAADVGCIDPVGIEDRLDQETRVFQDRAGRIKIDSKNIVESASVYDLSGKLIYNGQVKNNTIRLSDSREGFHLVKLNTSKGSIVRKMVLTK